ncbi:hypothetical protein NDU88_004050 [Pleurodeles waltl]|uniref:Uncharacterized protein n=1 Tax=Pleurodeles waltl TaxID=8319 RepID=A0AAV7T8L9_PLEWA|nr:hypothetical protein NDU88_004050 [Pleurodeles waltl]
MSTRDEEATPTSRDGWSLEGEWCNAITEEQLQQEAIHLKEQHIDLQAHTEDLENRTRLNNLRIRGTPHGAEDGDVESYVEALFAQVLDASDDKWIQLDRAHRVGLPQPGPWRNTDIVVSVHDFPVKEQILRKARE